jgi:hypothetical protein
MVGIEFWVSLAPACQHKEQKEQSIHTTQSRKRRGQQHVPVIRRASAMVSFACSRVSEISNTSAALRLLVHDLLAVSLLCTLSTLRLQWQMGVWLTFFIRVRSPLLLDVCATISSSVSMQTNDLRVRLSMLGALGPAVSKTRSQI